MKCGGDLAMQIYDARIRSGEEPAGFIRMEEVQLMLGPEGVGDEIDYSEADQLRRLLGNSSIRWEESARNLLEYNVRLCDERVPNFRMGIPLGIAAALGVVVGIATKNPLLGFSVAAIVITCGVIMVNINADLEWWVRVTPVHELP